MTTALRVFAAGPSECGKTRLCWELFVSRFPRRLTFDFPREVRAKLNPDAITVYSYAEVRDALGDLAGVKSWHIALCLDPSSARDVAPKVCRLLAHPTRSDDERTYARSIGGLVVDCYEVHELAPNGAAPDDVRALVTRGRHERISVVVATQAPSLCDRRFSENANVLIAFATQEHTAWKFWSSKTCARVADMIDEQEQYHAAYFDKGSRTIYWLDDRRAVLRVTDYAGNEITAGDDAGTSRPDAELEVGEPSAAN